MDYKYGHFNPDGTEFIVTRPDCPRAFDNFLFNECSQANVEQTGIGWFDYQIGDKEAVQLYTGIGRICDFDVFGRDHLMSRLIYIRDNETIRATGLGILDRDYIGVYAINVDAGLRRAAHAHPERLHLRRLVYRRSLHGHQQGDGIFLYARSKPDAVRQVDSRSLYHHLCRRRR